MLMGLGVFRGRGGGCLLGGLDTLPTARLVAVFVLAAGGEIGYTSTSDVHGVGTLFVVGQPTRPFNCAVGVGGVSTGPDTDSNVHGGLREVLSVIRIFVMEGADEVPVNVPFDLLSCPERGVVVEVLLRLIDRIVDSTVVGRSVALSKVVGFSVGIVDAHEFPIDFVQIVGFEDDAADDSLARGGFQPDLDDAEEKVELGLDRGGFASHGDGHSGAIGPVLDCASGGVPDSGVSGRFGEVKGVVHAQCRICRAAGAVQGIASSPCLGLNHCNQRCKGKKGES